MSRHHRKRLSSRRWARTRKAAFRRDKYRCRYCGKASRLEADHIKPFMTHPRQNPYDLKGIQTLCRGCHIAKTRQEVKEWREKNGILPRPKTPWEKLVGELM